MSRTDLLNEDRAFPETRWTRVLAARSDPGTEDEAHAALRYLCEVYWRPVYGFARRLGRSHEDSEDLVQGFFAHLLENRLFERADPLRGRFRSFLLASFRHFINQDHRDAHRLKRGGSMVLLSFDESLGPEFHAAEAAGSESPDHYFDRVWAATVMKNTLERLEAEYQQKQQEEVFRSLSPFLAAEEGDTSITACAERLGLSPGAARIALFRLRQRFRTLLESEVKDTMDSDTSVEEELRYLAQVSGRRTS